MMLRRLRSFWEGLFSGAMLNFRGVIFFKSQLQLCVHVELSFHLHHLSHNKNQGIRSVKYWLFNDGIQKQRFMK